MENAKPTGIVFPVLEADTKQRLNRQRMIA
jgi:hypothetical protein